MNVEKKDLAAVFYNEGDVSIYKYQAEAWLSSDWIFTSPSVGTF